MVYSVCRAVQDGAGCACGTRPTFIHLCPAIRGFISDWLHAGVRGKRRPSGRAACEKRRPAGRAAHGKRRSAGRADYCDCLKAV